MRNVASQIGSLVTMNIRALPSRLNSSSVAIIGIAGVVLIWITLLAATEGFSRVLERAGGQGIVLIMRDGSATEVTSMLTGPQIRIVSDAEAVARDADGAWVSAELFFPVDVTLASNNQTVSGALRGVGPRGAALREGFRIEEGRNFVAGKQEVIVGSEAARQYSGLAVGSRVRLGPRDWLVVGHFADRGSVAQSEIWGDFTTLQDAYRYGNNAQTIRARLAPGASAHTLSEQLSQDSRVSAQVVTEEEYYADQSRPVTDAIKGVGRAVTFIMALGAIFGALNAMYSAVASRTREIATLRALGFGSNPIVLSVICEALILGLVGGMIGALLALVVVDGLRFSTMNFLTYTQVAFAFTVTPAMFAQGLLYALILGLIGGFLPCIRAARLPVADSLRL